MTHFSGEKREGGGKRIFVSLIISQPHWQAKEGRGGGGEEVGAGEGGGGGCGGSVPLR